MTRAFVVLSAAVLFSIPGCFVSTNDPTPVAANNASGSLTVDWTINNSTDPNQCHQSVVADIDLIVTSPNGATVDEVTQPCVDGVTTVALSPGVYGGNAALQMLPALNAPRGSISILSPSTVVLIFQYQSISQQTPSSSRSVQCATFVGLADPAICRM